MNLTQLKGISNLFASYKYISFSRINKNDLYCKLDSSHFLFLSETSDVLLYKFPLNNHTIKNTPFDIKLKQFSNSNLISCNLLGLNKILNFELKKQEIININLYVELIPNKFNVILTRDQKVLTALRYNERIKLNSEFSFLEQPKFFKIIKNDLSIETIKEELEHKVTKILESKRNKILLNLNKKINKLETILNSLNEKKLLSEYNDCINLANKYFSSSLYKEKDEIFKKSKRIKRRINNLNLEKENLNEKINFLQNKVTICKNADLNKLGILESQHQKSHKHNVKKQIYENFFINGIKVSVGRNEKENIALLKDSKAAFYWLHIANVASSHMIIHSTSPSYNTILNAAKLLAELMSQQEKATIDYTKRRFVKMISGAKVIYSKEKRLVINLS